MVTVINIITLIVIIIIRFIITFLGRVISTLSLAIITFKSKSGFFKVLKLIIILKYKVNLIREVYLLI